MKVHAALVAFLLLVHLWPVGTPDPALLDRPLEASPFELHVLGRRTEVPADRFGPELVEALAAAESPLRELPYTNTLASFRFPEAQLRELLGRSRDPVDASLWLAYFFQFDKPGGFAVGATGGMTRRELLWTLAAMDGVGPGDVAREVMEPTFQLVRRYLGRASGK